MTTDIAVLREVMTHYSSYESLQTNVARYGNENPERRDTNRLVKCGGAIGGLNAPSILSRFMPGAMARQPASGTISDARGLA